MDMVVDHSAEEVVRSGYCVHISRKMKVYILHGYYLSISAAGSAALYSEYRSEGRFTQSKDSLFAYPAHSFFKSYRNSSLSLTRRSRVDSCNKDQLSVGTVGEFAEKSA